MKQEDYIKQRWRLLNTLCLLSNDFKRIKKELISVKKELAGLDTMLLRGDIKDDANINK